MPTIDVRLGDCLDEMKTLDDSSVNLICVDPPYMNVKRDLGWDRQWKTDADYLDWMGRLCAEWSRVLAPNGSLYVFASPRMAARVECKIAERFDVLNSIVWNKLHDYEPGDRRATAYKARDHESFRRYFDYSERIIFAEHPNSDGHARGEAGYAAKCDELRGFIFEPLRAYLDGERQRAGVSVRQVAEAFQRKTGSRTVTGMAGHWFGLVQWELPTAENYSWLRGTFAALNHDGQYLRREYEDLRREYEDLRRPFSVDASDQYTDVWSFPTVQFRPGKHPCQKPLGLISQVVKASSRPGDMVLDCFAGSGVVGRACEGLGRRCILIEKDPHWHAKMAAEFRPDFALSPA